MESITGSEIIIPKFSATIEIPYDLRFMAIALNFTNGLVSQSGGIQKESDSLSLAVDETLTFLINSYPDAEIWEQIRIAFALQPDNTVEISITNAGPPVHLSRIPLYNPQMPSESDLDGLWYFLAREAVDDLTFQNRGWDGWRVLIRKRLTGTSFAVKTEIATIPDTAPVRKTPFVTRLARPEDAPALVDLTYATYRYSYPGEAFYHEPKLRELLTKGEIISIVVEADGCIIGNSSFIISPQMPRCAYSCSLMIKPAFRQSQAIIHLLREIDKLISSGSLGVDVYYGSPVTTHTGSQKAGVRTGFKPLALQLAACVVVDFRGMKNEATERETLVICVRFATAPALSVIYLPGHHHAVMTGLLAQAGIHCQLSEKEELPAREQSEFTEEEDAGQRCAYLIITTLGNDWTTRVQKKIFAFKTKGIKTVIILIPAWRPIPPELDREMGRFNAIFTGVMPVSAKECHLVYSALSDTVDFDHILLHDPLAHDLKEHCRRLYEEMTAE